MSEETFGTKIDNILPYLYEESWFNDPNQSSIWCRFYSMIGIPWASGDDVFRSAPKLISHTYPVKTLYCNVSELERVYPRIHIVSNPDGTPLIISAPDMRKIPRSLYAILSAPFNVDGQDGNEREVKACMDRVVAIMRLYAGSNFLRELVMEEIVEAGFRNKHALSNVVAMPYPVEGPYTGDDVWREINDSLHSLHRLKNVDRKRRLELALELFENGANRDERNKFFYYWVAIERVCDSHNTQEIKRQLAGYYETSTRYIRNELGFERLVHMRTDLFHRGVKQILNAQAERFIQMVFLDLLRNQLHLPCQFYARSLLSDGQFSLKDLAQRDRSILVMHESGKAVVETVQE